MLYETQRQPIVLLSIIAAGLLCGVLFDLAKLPKHKLFKNIGVFFAVLLSFLVYYCINLFLNYGETRFYVIALFVLFICFERFISLKVVALIKKRCYNNLYEKKGSRKRKGY